MNVVPGTFVANGHDYRASLPRMVSVAYDLPADDATIATMEQVLAARELRWAEERVIEQAYADARSDVAERLAKWGVVADQPGTTAWSLEDAGQVVPVEAKATSEAPTPD